MVVLESAAVICGAYGYMKHRKHKKERASQLIVAAPQGVYAKAVEHAPPPSYSTAVLAPANDQAPLVKQVSNAPEHDDSLPKTLTLSDSNTVDSDTVDSNIVDSNTVDSKIVDSKIVDSKIVEEGKEWRRVYMLERSTSKNNFNKIRTHRALFVGDFFDGEGSGKAHEIRKETSSSFLGVRLPFGRTMRYTDAEEWTEGKALDRDPVFLGYTDWTDEELNRNGHEMVDNYPTYTLTYSNCQHFVADLAEKIIPPDKMNYDGMDKTQPTFDKLMDDIASEDHEGHGDAILHGAASLALEAGKQTTKFFHFTKAVVKSMVARDWRSFDDFNRWLRAENMRAIAAHSREDKKRGPRYISGTSTGSSAASVSTQ